MAVYLVIAAVFAIGAWRAADIVRLQFRHAELSDAQRRRFALQWRIAYAIGAIVSTLVGLLNVTS